MSRSRSSCETLLSLLQIISSSLIMGLTSHSNTFCHDLFGKIFWKSFINAMCAISQEELKINTVYVNIFLKFNSTCHTLSQKFQWLHTPVASESPSGLVGQSSKCKHKWLVSHDVWCLVDMIGSEECMDRGTWSK